MGTLSVRENLQFSAALRLPGDMTRDQRRERVEGVIETLGLYQCANTKVRLTCTCTWNYIVCTYVLQLYVFFRLYLWRALRVQCCPCRHVSFP